MSNEKSITMTQLQNEGNSEVQQPQVQQPSILSTEALAAKVIETNPDAAPKVKENSIVANLKEDIGNLLERTKQEAEAINNQREQEAIQNEIENEDSQDSIDEDSIPMEESEDIETELVFPDEDKAVTELSGLETEIDEEYEDFDDDDIDEEETEQYKIQEKKQLKQLKKVISNSITPITNVIDLSKFTISKKPVAVSKVLAAKKEKTVVDWVLYNTGKSISMSEFEGYEIEKLNPKNTNKNRISLYRDIYQTIYNHIIDENKPKTLEGWLKTVKYSDNDHIYFAAYMASFLGSNKIPYNCVSKDCEEVFMSEFSMPDMVKFKTAEIKEKVLKMKEQDSTGTGKIEVELQQVSDSYVFGFKDPSIYNIIFENSILDEDFIIKYKDALGLIAYIDSMYFINNETNQLELISYKTYPESIIKTVKSKVKSFAKILSQLSSDQFSNLNSLVSNMISKADNDDVYYVLPATTCPKCGESIPEQRQTARNLLFTRHQLVSIANTLVE